MPPLTPRALALLLTIAGLTTGALPAVAELLEYTEDFTGHQRRDAAHTTALWDTLAGELRLPPRQLAPRGSWNTLGTAYDGAVSGTHLLVADGTAGLLSVSIADPDLPDEADTWATADQARALALSGGWAFVAVGAAGLETVAIADPTALAGGGTADCPGFTTDVAVAGGWAYLAQSGDGVAVCDVTTPSAPLHVADVATDDWVRGVAVAGARLLVADGSAGLKVMSLAAPAAPVTVGGLDTPGTALGVAASGDLAFLADGGSLRIIDIADPFNPFELGSLDLAGTCQGVSVSGDTVLVTAGSGGLHLVDVSQPTEPERVGGTSSQGTSYRAAVAGLEIWLADGSAGVRGFTADPEGLDETANEARSLDLDDGTDPLLRARLVADFTDSVTFFLSGDGGDTWTAVAPDGSWLDFPVAATDLRWRALLAVAGGGGPVVRSVTVGYERLHSYGEITDISDVPGDEGGQVRVRWLASRHDAAGGNPVVTEYSVYRRIDAGKRYPEGEWEWLLTVPADREALYAATVPTLADSAVWSVFFVRARTGLPGVFFDSPPDSGRSVDDLSPPPPTGLQVDRSQPPLTILGWDPSPLTDFAHFRVYRAAAPINVPGPAQLHHVTTDNGYTDPQPGLWHYALTVVDLAGRESEPARSVSAVPAAPTPLRLGPAVPNPANPRTVFAFTVPAGGAHVRAVVFDLRGRRVRTLADRWHAGGEHLCRWDGRDDGGGQVASGVYSLALDASGQRLSAAVTLVR